MRRFQTGAPVFLLGRQNPFIKTSELKPLTVRRANRFPDFLFVLSDFMVYFCRREYQARKNMIQDGDQMSIITGNIISLAAAAFLAASCVMKSRNGIFAMQFMNCALLAAASYFFGSYAAISTLILCCVRNVLILRERFTKNAMTAIVVLVVILGIMTNNRGAVGLMPVIATVEYTICCRLIRDVKRTRVSVLVNEAIWLIYSFIIFDFSTALTDVAVIIVDILAIVREKRAEG